MRFRHYHLRRTPFPKEAWPGFVTAIARVVARKLRQRVGVAAFDPLALPARGEPKAQHDG